MFLVVPGPPRLSLPRSGRPVRPLRCALGDEHRLICGFMVGSRDTPIYSVADLDRRLKRAVEGATPDVWVEGEVSGAKTAPSGHVYFLLKDEREDAAIECVMYRSASVRARRLVADGA